LQFCPDPKYAGGLFSLAASGFGYSLALYMIGVLALGTLRIMKRVEV
jgi:hypothetical protein